MAEEPVNCSHKTAQIQGHQALSTEVGKPGIVTGDMIAPYNMMAPWLPSLEITFFSRIYIIFNQVFSDLIPFLSVI